MLAQTEDRKRNGQAAAAAISVARVAGCPDLIDAIAAAAPEGHTFLRAAWYRAAGADATLVVRRGARPIAAFPTLPAGPPALGARALAGIYWPFRSPVIAAGVSDTELAEALNLARNQGLLGPAWRIGPVYGEDFALAALDRAAPKADWAMLVRRLGRTWTLDIEAVRAETGQWPRPSTVKRLRGYERALAQRGTLTIDRVIGAGWTAQVFDDLAAIEARSWIAQATDQSGAKFINAAHRLFWEQIVVDPMLAGMLSAVIVRVGGRPVAFSLDLAAGALQYGIAGTYDAEFAALNAGSLANERNLEWAAERGITRFDWGAGDGGYKRKLGFVAGSPIVDCLFVRNPLVAALLRPRWERMAREEAADEAGRLPLGRRELLILASLATAAAAAGAMAD